MAELVKQCDALKKGREDSDEREEALNELKAAEQKHKELKDEMAQFADNDPDAFEAIYMLNYIYIIHYPVITLISPLIRFVCFTWLTIIFALLTIICVSFGCIYGVQRCVTHLNF